jgi:glycosyltransferase involved in cell wall biosynthesis
MARPIRVALFPDSLNEVNGVANTCRNFVAYARRNEFPMLVISASPKTSCSQDGVITYFGLKRGALSFRLEADLSFDLVLLRYYRKVLRALREFQPDVVHITGPSDLGILGAVAGHALKIPVAAGWHTNIHEYAARRAAPLLPRWINSDRRARLLQKIEDWTFKVTALYYDVARFHYAPNQELIDKLHAATKKPCALMERGVDLGMFSPTRRDRGDDGQFVIGYVGRLSTEKKIRSFLPLSQAVKAAGHKHVKFAFVGHGGDQDWLRKNLPEAEMPGVLRGEPLARAYANLDLFAFFSETDTFGNVVLEALASGVPAVVTDKGGPKFIVEHERSGFICPNDEEFTRAVLRLIAEPELHRQMAIAARQRAQRASWDSVFGSVYETYQRELALEGDSTTPAQVREKLAQKLD